jgi:autotransporter translocation and assembly factor TamB
LSRFWWGLVLAVLVLPVLLVVVMLFTEAGSRALITGADRLLPIDIEYRKGTVAGRLELSRLLWAGDTLRVELDGLVAELAPDCLWRSAICFALLQAGELDISLLPGPGDQETQAHAAAPTPSAEVAVDASPFVFPVPIEVAALMVDSARLGWQGGEWRQGKMMGSVVLAGSRIHLTPTTVRDARLELTSSEEDGAAISLPEIDLPLELVVDELVLEQPGWDMNGSRQGLDHLSLAGGWHNKQLRLDQLKVMSTELGQWIAALEIELAGQWPLTLKASALLPEVAGWPDVLQRDLAAAASGSLAALVLDLRIGGEVALVAQGELDALNPELPFDFLARADWPGTLELAALAAVPEALGAIELTAPFKLAARGTLAEQLFQLEANGSGQGYQDVDLHIAGRHQAGLLFIEDMRLQDGAGNNTLWGSGALAYGAQLQWSLGLETGGFELPAGTDLPRGLFAGSLRLAGSTNEGGWQLGLSDLELQGTVNDLPAHISGYVGIDSDLKLSASDLQAELNEARALLRTSGEDGMPGQFELTVADLGRWLPDSKGRLSLRGEMAADWQQLDWSGTVGDITWSGISVASGELSGNYTSGPSQLFRLDLALAQLELAGVALTDLRLTADGTGVAQTLSLRSRGDVEGALVLDGVLRDDGDWAGKLAATSLQTAQGTWHLGEPVAVGWSAAARQLRVAEHCWHYQQTSVCPGVATVGETGSASLAVTGGLDFLSEFLPADMEVLGDLQSQFAASWSPQAGMSFDGELETRDVRFTQLYGAGESGTVYWDKSRFVLHKEDRGLAVTGEIHRDGNRILELAVRLPEQRSEPLSGTVEFTSLQLAALQPFAPGLASLQGELTGKLQLQGTVDQPLALGLIRLAGGRLELVGNPTRLENLEIALDARGDWAAISGKGLLGGGALDLSGKVLSRPDWRAELAINGVKHQLLVPPYSQALVSEQLQLVIADGLLDVRGDIVVHEGTLEHEELPEGSVGLSDDVVEVDYSGNVLNEARPFNTSMALMIKIDDKFKILGDMINATLGGDLQLLQAPRQPLQLFGNLNVIGGELRAYQQRLRIKRGTISFSGSPGNPELDVQAQRQISSEKIIVGLRLEGTLEQPNLDIFSDPVMSQGETMSYLVRGRGLDSGASGDGMAMALSLGGGLMNRSKLVTELNRIPGVNNLEFGAEGSAEETAATVGGYIGNRLYLSYGMGIYEPIYVLTARLYLQTRLWLEVVSRLESSVDLYYSFDIE